MVSEREVQHMKSFRINHISTARNAGIAREHDLCAHFGINRDKHDNINYRKASDIHFGNERISVKSARFTLMSGNLCNGAQTAEDIWNVFKNTTNANVFAYVTADFEVYMMDVNEFERFVKTFCKVVRDSEQNGGQLKLRCGHETKEMRRWLASAL